MKKRRWPAVGMGLGIGLIGCSLLAMAQQAPSKEIAELQGKLDGMKAGIDTLWTLITGMLVFFMNLGFATVESGMCRVKNAVNILSKNFIVFAVSSVGFWVIGWGLMFGDGNGFIGMAGLWFAGGADNSPAVGDAYKGVYSALNTADVGYWTKFFFELVFAGTAATIVSGAVAERIKYISFIVFTFFITGIIYPIVGHWIWGGGWLASKGFMDFSGSTQVHSIGGWAAVAGVFLLGPRIGKYSPDGKVNPIPGHSMMAATIGTFVLWFGWFGFNPGSTFAVNARAIGEICVTTNTAAAVATLTATVTSWIMMGKPDLGMTLNGCLAGLVAITAPCAFVSVGASAVIGAIAGVLVVFAVQFWDKMKLDDPVGALSVHLANGIWGTISCGLFATQDRIDELGNKMMKAGLFYGGGAGQLITQLTGVVSVGAFVFTLSFVTWFVIKKTIGMRVSAEEELQGLDLGEHGMEAYAGFQTVQGK
jgi:Amt family ammonium transporter